MKNVFIILFLTFSIGLFAADNPQKAPKVFDAPQKEGVKATCPVTGEEFTISKDTPHSEYKGKHIYFCCDMCKPTFDKDPEKYLSDGQKKGDGTKEKKKGGVKEEKRDKKDEEKGMKGEGEEMHKHNH
ncbi:MAG: YHS domain-containing protein [Myxococcota bacterium]